MDTWLGDLSYPIYLIHFLVGFIVEVTWLGREVRGPKLFSASLPWVIASAWAIHIILDSTLESWRGTLRDRASSDRDRSS